MKRIILVCTFALLAACGSSKDAVSVDTTADQPPATGAPATDSVETTAGSDTTASSTEGSADTISVDNFEDMPPKCIELFTSFLKQIEPEASKIDWANATLGQFQTFGTEFQAESDAFDAETAAAGCDKYNLDPTDKTIFAQVVELAAAEAPGTVGFLTFIGALNDASTSSGGSVPTDCAGAIAAIEPLIAGGGTMNDLTVAEVTRLSGLMGSVSTNCTTEESTAFFARDDVKAFIGS